MFAKCCYMVIEPVYGFNLFDESKTLAEADDMIHGSDQPLSPSNDRLKCNVMALKMTCLLLSFLHYLRLWNIYRYPNRDVKKFKWSTIFLNYVSLGQKKTF